MENQTSEIHDWDWELIPNSSSSTTTTKSPSSPSSIGGGVIHSEYFSLYSDMNYTATSTDDGAVTNNSSDEVEEGDSDNPSWVDPSYSTVVCGNNNTSGGGKRKRSVSPASSSYSPSSSDDLDLIIQPHSDCCGGQFSRSSEIDAENNSAVGSFDEQHEVDENGENSGENDVEVNSINGSFDGGHEVNENDQVSGFSVEDEEEKKREENENEKRVVWWKVPMEVLRYCAMRVSPVWTLSMAAAALMGLVILRRRYLQKIKRKSLGIQLKVTVDDKKVSQVMSRVARLNEAFSVVKRVPIIRPALPAPGMATWPMMSLR